MKTAQRDLTAAQFRRAYVKAGWRRILLWFEHERHPGTSIGGIWDPKRGTDARRWTLSHLSRELSRMDKAARAKAKGVK